MDGPSSNKKNQIDFSETASHKVLVKEDEILNRFDYLVFKTFNLGHIRSLNPY